MSATFGACPACRQPATFTRAYVATSAGSRARWASACCYAVPDVMPSAAVRRRMFAVATGDDIDWSDPWLNR